jgi:hypothetical protein
MKQEENQENFVMSNFVISRPTPLTEPSCLQDEFKIVFAWYNTFWGSEGLISKISEILSLRPHNDYFVLIITKCRTAVYRRLFLSEI